MKKDLSSSKMAKRKTQKFKLKLKGKTAVFIDWANVYNWKSSLKKIENNKIIAWKRKCDFDLEIGLDCFEGLEKYDGFIFFSGDGDNVPQPKAEGVISFVYTK